MVVALLQASSAAKWLTIFQVTTQHIFKDAWGYIFSWNCSVKNWYFSREVGQPLSRIGAILILDIMAFLLWVMGHFSTSLLISQGIKYTSWWKVSSTFRLLVSDGLNSVFLLILLFKAHFNDCQHSRDVERWHMEFIFGALRARLEQWDVKETNISTETTLAFCSE